jgi:N-acetylmuramoyl-L-alanine amidase
MLLEFIIFKSMREKIFRRSARLILTLLLSLPVGWGFPMDLSAQSVQGFLSTPRADGLGFVGRLQMDARVDSFVIIQSADSLLQILLYGAQEPIKEDLVRTFRMGEFSPFQSVESTPIAAGLGIDLTLSEAQPYQAQMYRDAASNDLLIALTETDDISLAILTDGIPIVTWPSMVTTQRQGDGTSVDDEDSENDRRRRGLFGRRDRADSQENSLPEDQTNTPSTQDDEEYNGVKENLKFDVVVLDAGHGGHDPGTIGVSGLYEKDIVLSVTKKVGAYIEEYLPDVKVVYTREDDRFIELHERGAIANRAQGDLFVSIHANSARSRSAYGAEVYFLGLTRTESALEVMKRENSVVRLEESTQIASLSEEDVLIYELANAANIETSQEIAARMEQQFSERARRRSRGVKQAPFVVLYHASMPALLVELGFISNAQEAQFLNSDYGQSIMASAIFRAIRDTKIEQEGEAAQQAE